MFAYPRYCLHGRQASIPNSKMSITTKRGDTGQTDLLFGKRVPKCHSRIEALGAVDSLTSALGLVRIHAQAAQTQQIIPRIQQELVALMGIVVVTAEDYPRYVQDGFANLGVEHVERLTSESAEMEALLPRVTDWILPGSKGSLASAHLDMARAFCRHAECAVLGLGSDDALANPHVIPYLNRLSDLLWILARIEETPPR